MANDGKTLALEKTGGAGAQAAAVSSAMSRIEAHAQWPLLQRLPLQISVSLTIPLFRVRDLLALRPGNVIASAWSSNQDLPLRVSDVAVFWCEFEVVEQSSMAVRLTRLQ